MDSDANFILEFTDDLKCYVAFKHVDLEKYPYTEISQIELWLLRDWPNENVASCITDWYNLDSTFVNQHVRAYTERIIQVLKDMDSDANLILEFTDDLKCYVAFKHMDLEQNTDIGQIEIWLLRDWINEDIDH
ncbi:hypothetical protein BGZ93_002723, partial [Podila epicladia]